MTRTLIALVTLALATTAPGAPKVKLGIDVLRDSGFAALAEKRVGLVANPASVDASLRPSIDVLRAADNVRLVALFGPEHGVYGDEYAGDKIEDRTDPRTGLPVYSLYGATRKPTPAMLEGLDALVFDLQDIGSRSYTYISTMKVCMQACAEAGIEFVVLDRPNPMGGRRVEGPGLRTPFESFIGLLYVPYVHGMTMGELARLVRADELPGYERLTVVPMEGWTREMTWRDTGLAWVPTSPHIPTPEAAIAYAATGMIGELLVISNGVGYTQPFEIVGAPGLDGEALAERLNAQGLSGIHFRPVRYKPFYATAKGEKCQGVQVHIDPAAEANLVEVNHRILALLEAPRLFAEAKPARHSMFDKANGSDEARRVLSEAGDLEALFAAWREQCAAFVERRQPFLLY